MVIRSIGAMQKKETKNDRTQEPRNEAGQPVRMRDRRLPLRSVRLQELQLLRSKRALGYRPGGAALV
jgi:hypothetical protein